MSWQKDKTLRWFTYFGLGILALIPRLWGIGRLSFWYDETFSVLAALRLSWVDVVQEIAFSVHPPLHFLLLRLFSIFGSSEAIMRLPSAIFGALSVILIFRIAEKTFRRPTAWLAAALFILSTYHVYYSQEARMYALFSFLSLLSMDRFLEVWEEPSLGNGLGLALVNSLNLYTHYFAVFVIAVQWLTLLGISPPQGSADLDDDEQRERTQNGFELIFPTDQPHMGWSAPARLAPWLLLVFSVPITVIALSFAWRRWADGWPTQFLGLGSLSLHIMAIVMLRALKEGQFNPDISIFSRLWNSDLNPLLQLGLSTVLTLITFLPWSVFLARQLLGRGGEGIGHAATNTSDIVASLIRSYGGSEWLAWVFLAVIVVGLLLDTGKWYRLILGLWVVAPLVITLAANQILQFVTLRNLIFILPAYLLLVAEGLYLLSIRLVKTWNSRFLHFAVLSLLLVFLVTAGTPLASYLISPQTASLQISVPAKPEWRQVLEGYDDADWPAKLLIFPIRARNRLPIRYYLGNRAIIDFAKLDDNLTVTGLLGLGETHTFRDSPIEMPLFFAQGNVTLEYEGLIQYKLDGRAVLQNRVQPGDFELRPLLTLDFDMENIEVKRQADAFMVSAPQSMTDLEFLSPPIPVIEHTPFMASAELIGVENAVFTYSPRLEIQFLDASDLIIEHTATQNFSRISVPDLWQPVFLSGSVPTGATKVLLIYRIPRLRSGETVGLRNPMLHILNLEAMGEILLPNRTLALDLGIPFPDGDTAAKNSIPDGWSIWDGNGRLFDQVELAMLKAAGRSDGSVLQIKAKTGNLDTILASASFPVSAGTLLRFSGTVSQSSADMRTRLELQYMDQRGDTLVFRVSDPALTSGTWEQLEIASEVPDGATHAKVRIRLPGHAAEGDRLWIDGISPITIERTVSN